jgi:GT2 family glycosyltransferase
MQWYEQLSRILKLHEISPFALIAYMHKMALHHAGSPTENRALVRSVEPQMRRPASVGSEVTLVVNGRTSDGTRALLARKGAAFIESSDDQPQAETLIGDIFARTDSEWILQLNDDELPTPWLLDFVDRAVLLGVPAWGLPRAHFRYDPERRELQYSQFLVPFGDYGDYDRQWRLFARSNVNLDQPHHSGIVRKEGRAAPSAALIFHFGWVLHSRPERLEKVSAQEEQDRATGQAYSHSQLCETIPESWHMFMPLGDEKYRTFAERLYRSRTGADFSQTADLPEAHDKVGGRAVVEGAASVVAGTAAPEAAGRPSAVPRADRETRPAVSAAICTYMRYNLLTQAIASLTRQNLDRSEYEILVIDNSPDSELSKRMAADYAPIENLRWITEETPGISNARNVAIAQANSPFVAFLDDDAIARPGWLDAILRAFDQFGADVGAVGGKVNPLWGAPRPAWLHEHLLSYLSVIDWGRETREITRDEWLVGANLAVSVAAVKEIGGFKTHLGRREGGLALLSNDEAEVINGLKGLGYRVVYEPDAEVDHLISAERLSQAWMRRRVVWQAISDYLIDPTAHFNAAADKWVELEAFASQFGQPDWPARAALTATEDPDEFDKLMTALRNHTMVMLSGFHGIALEPGAISVEAQLSGLGASDPAPRGAAAPGAVQGGSGPAPTPSEIGDTSTIENRFAGGATVLDVYRPSAASGVLGIGWGEAEMWGRPGRWTVGPEAEVTMALPPGGGRHLEFSACIGKSVIEGRPAAAGGSRNGRSRCKRLDGNGTEPASRCPPNFPKS